MRNILQKRAKSIVIIVFCVSSVTLLWWHQTPQSPRSETVFVYATLTNPIVRFYACRCLTPFIPDNLPQYQKSGRTILPQANSLVRGGRIQVTQTELNRLDHYESLPQKYRRIQATTTSNIPVWVYIKNP